MNLAPRGSARPEVFSIFRSDIDHCLPGNTHRHRYVDMQKRLALSGWAERTRNCVPAQHVLDKPRWLRQLIEFGQPIELFSIVDSLLDRLELIYVHSFVLTR